MIKTRFVVVKDGLPIRFHSGSNGRICIPDQTMPNEFQTAVDANKRCSMFGLTGYELKEIQRDFGEPTRLSELGL